MIIVNLRALNHALKHDTNQLWHEYVDCNMDLFLTYLLKFDSTEINRQSSIDDELFDFSFSETEDDVMAFYQKYWYLI